MEEQRPNYLQQIPPEDWERTPGSVKTLVEEMAQGMEQLKQQQTEFLAIQQQLLEKVNRTSKNSSSPPSLDPPGFGKKPVKKKSSKKRGGFRLNRIELWAVNFLPKIYKRFNKVTPYETLY